MDREPSQELTNRNGKLDILLTPQASFFEHVGVTLPISERHPAALSGIGERPLDIFAKSDTPTKSGILITTEMYGRLLQRPDSRKLSDDERRTLKQFLLEKQIGSGHVLAAVPSSVDGLSWAPDPDIRQQELVREVTGSSKASTYGSYNIFVATMAAPTYFERLAQMHSQKGNSQESDLLRKEAERIGIIIEKHQKAA